MSENTSPMPDFTTENTSNEIPFINPNINQTRQDSKQEESRPKGFSHQADLIRAAMPYASGTNQQSMNVILKVSELMNTMQNPEPELSACSTDNSNGGVDMEGLLTSLKNVCHQREADIINMLLNTIHARRFYQTYQTVAATMADEPSLSAASLGGNNGRNQSNNTRANSGGNNMNAVLNNPLMKDMLDSFMSPEQRSSFNNITNMINTMSTMNSMNNMNPTNGMNNTMNNNPNNMNSGMNNNMYNNSNNMNSGTNNNINNNPNNNMNNSINNAMNIMSAMNGNSNMNGGMNNAMNIMNAMNAMNSMNNPSNFSAPPNVNPVNAMNNAPSPSNNTNSRAPMGNMNPNSSRSSASPNNGRTNMNRGGMNNRNSMSPPTMNHLHVMELMNAEEDSDQDFLSGDASPDLA